MSYTISQFPFTSLTNDTQILLPEGHDYAGHQAIVVLPSKPFPLMKLSDEVRSRIWQYVLAPQGHLEGKVVISNATGGKSGVSAKEYTQGIKQHRLGCLLVNKEVSPNRC